MSYPEFEKRADAKELYPGFITADESLQIETMEDVERAKELQLAHNNQWDTVMFLTVTGAQPRKK